MSIELSDMRGNWSFPTTVRFGVGRIVELPEACRELGMTRPLVVTDKGLAPLPMLRDSVAALSDAGLGGSHVLRRAGQPHRSECGCRSASLSRRRPRRRGGFRRWQCHGCGQMHRAHGRANATTLGFRRSRGLVHTGRSGRHRAGDRCADDFGDWLRGGSSRCHHQSRGPYQTHHFSPRRCCRASSSRTRS